MRNGIQTVLITGASSGIGRAAAIRLAERGYTVIGASRRLERLAGMFADAENLGLRVFGVELDVNSDESVASVAPGLAAQFGGIHALVNNAGFGVWGPVETISDEELKAQFEANFFGAARMIRAFLPDMISRRTGRVINISSVLGRMGTPFNGAYVASKYALEGLSESLRAEVKPFGVRVCLVQPGLFATDFQKNQLRAARADDPSLAYAPHIERYDRSHGKFDRLAGDPARVARVIANVMDARNPALRHPVGADARAGMLGARFLPERVFQAIMDRATMGT